MTCERKFLHIYKHNKELGRIRSGQGISGGYAFDRAPPRVRTAVLREREPGVRRGDHFVGLWHPYGYL